MRTLAVAVVLGVFGTSSLAFAEGWRAKAALEPGAPADCQEADVSKLFFDFTETGSEVLVKTTDGRAFLAPMAGDGSIATTITVPVGAKKFAVNLTGNAKTREFEVFNKAYSCRFKLIPVQ